MHNNKEEVLEMFTPYDMFTLIYQKKNEELVHWKHPGGIKSLSWGQKLKWSVEGQGEDCPFVQLDCINVYFGYNSQFLW